MKTNRTLATLMGAMAILIFTSSENGVAEDQNKDRTGAPGSSNPCSQCHDDAQFGPNMVIEVLEMGTMMSIAEYLPGETYQLRFSVNASGGSPSVHGFQATALIDETLANAGSFQMPGNFVQLEDVAGRHIVEHSDPNPSNFFMAEWLAPQAGQGNVTFYASGVAANDSGSSSGDGYDGATLTLGELNASVDESQQNVLDVFYTNGQLQISGDEGGEFTVYDLSGRVLIDQFIPEGDSFFDTSDIHSHVIICSFKGSGVPLVKKVVLN